MRMLADKADSEIMLFVEKKKKRRRIRRRRRRRKRRRRKKEKATNCKISSSSLLTQSPVPVQQGATSIDEYRATCKVSTSSLTMNVETVTYVLR